MWNARSTPARMIEVISPAAFEDFFRELVQASEAGPPDPDRIAPLAGRYQLRTAEPAWLPDVISRYGLTPPPAV